MDNLKLQSAVLNFFSDSLPLPVFFIPEEDPDIWHGVAPVSAGLHPIHFLLYYDRHSEKVRAAKRLFRRAAHSGRPALGRFAGLADLIVPIHAGRRPCGTVFCGSFLTQLPTRASLETQWRGLRRGAAPRQEFLDYCRTLLRTPLVDPVGQARLTPLLWSLGLFAAGQREAGPVLRQLARVRDHFARRGPWRMWHYAEARRERLFQGPHQGEELAPWDVEDFRLKAPLAAAVALAPAKPEGDEVDSLVRAAHLQWAVFEAARDLGGLVAGRLGYDGAVLLSPGGAAGARALAQRLLGPLERKLGFGVAAGLAARSPGKLDVAIRQAEFALQLALHQGHRIGVEGPVADAEGAAARDLPVLARLLAGALEPAEFRRLGRELGGAALTQSLRQPEILRVHLRWALEPLLARVPGAEARELDERFGRARTAHELLLAFEAVTEDLGLRRRSPKLGERRSRLLAAAQAMDGGLQEPLSLKQAAAQAGFSSSRFSRLFQRETGEGFGERLRRLRLERARQLLRSGDQSIGTIAAECGFTSASYFVRAFKAAEGISPGSYRRRR